MASDFLTGLSNQIGNQFGLGDNQNRSLDVAADGTSSRYGKLGDFAKQIDQSQQRSYVQEGYLRYDQYNASPKNLEILFQEPEATVLVKKRAFNSLADNYQLDHMSNDEKLFYKATKILFANKAAQIATFERLSKIQRVSAASGQFSDQLLPIVISLVDEYNSNFSGVLPDNLVSPSTSSSADSGMSQLSATLKSVKDVIAFSSGNFYTTWITDTSNIFKSQFGQGTGVLEFNNITNINTTVSLDSNGSFNFNISDPYNLMVITEFDIEKALSDATNVVYNNNVFQFGQSSINTTIASNTQQLNSLRAARGASQIQFMTDPTTVIGQKVTAIITGLGDTVNFTYNPAAGLAGIAPGLGGVTVSPEYLINATDPGYEGLNTANGSNSELSLFSTIIDNYYTQLQLLSSSQSITQQNNVKTNYARRKLRLHYLGYLCIQQMDQVHVYMGSKTRLDNKINGGLQNTFTGLNYLQKLNNTAADFRNTFDSLFNPNGNANFQLEKNIYAGPQFPNWLWTIMRSMFVDEKAGIHTFGGVVTGASSAYNEGAYTANISGSDMMHYLEQGYVNVKPSIDVFNGALYDPLSPFKSSYDTVSSNFKNNQFELLDENKAILANNIVKFKNGPLAGQMATEKNHSNSDAEHQNVGSVKQVFYSPDGLVYKWREGIGTFTHLSNSMVVQGDSTQGAPSISKDPFAGQDVMNVISLSITGQPYNYNNFYKATQNINGTGRDPQTGVDAAFSFYKSLTRDLVKNNVLWGNFVPFKNLFLDDKTFQKMLIGQITVQNANSQINAQMQQLTDLTNSLKAVLKRVPPGQTNSTATRLTNMIQQQQFALVKQSVQVYNQLTQATNTQGLSVVGNDATFDYNSNLGTGSDTSLTQSQIRKDLRRKVNMLTRRMSWQVRANEDKNLFIVDDSYDKDYDIQAFEKQISQDGIKSFDSEFDNVASKVRTVAQLLDLEVFCDTQGHIRCRPPQYNRMPSSVFYRLFQLKQATGTQIFPQFLEDLFVTQLDSLQTNFEVIEDQIRLDACLLGAATDAQAYTVIRGAFDTGTQFTFLTDESTGKLSDFNSVYNEANPDSKEGLLDSSLFSPVLSEQLQGQSSINNLFNIADQAALFVRTVVAPATSTASAPLPVNTTATQTRKTTLIARLQIATGQQVNVDQFLSSSEGSTAANTAATPDALKIMSDISSKITQRQQLVKQLSKAIENAKEYISLDSTTGQSTANSLLAPNLSQNSSIPEVFESMIEDETYDDLGPNSGKRYVVEDYNILQFTITTTAPDFTVVEVNGILGDFLEDSNLPQDTGKFVSGNSYISAAAVDYDMWRMFGFKNTHSIHVPFLTDPEGQMAPYAATILNRARQNILGGTLTIVGNEYMQPGDVIYLKSRGLLFYVTSVSHNFNFSGTFTTSLTLKYGHPAGEYIPTTLDVIGKMLYNNRNDTSYINRRQGSSFNQQNVGTVMLDKRNTTDVNTMLLQGSYGQSNSKVLNDVLYATYFAIESNKDPTSTVTPAVEIRTYYNSTQSQTAVDSSVTAAASAVQQILTGKYEFPNTVSPIGTNQTLSASNVAVVQIDLGGTTEFRSPSQRAVDLSRSISATTSIGTGDTGANNGLSSALYGYIIDIWVTFTNTSTS